MRSVDITWQTEERCINKGVQETGAAGGREREALLVQLTSP